MRTGWTARLARPPASVHPLPGQLFLMLQLMLLPLLQLIFLALANRVVQVLQKLIIQALLSLKTYFLFKEI